jgi:endonuclease YncB( thermonuclease family)
MGFLTIILSVLGSAGSVIGSILKAIPPIGWLCIVCVFAGVLLANKGCSCRTPKPPRPITYLTESFEVSSVVNGCTIKAKGGIRGNRIYNIRLADISCPADGQPFANESRQNLETLCGKSGTVKYERHGLFRADRTWEGEVDESGGPRPLTDAEFEAMKAELRGDLTGVVYSESGECLNTKQLYAGLAECLPDAEEGCVSAQNQAKKNKAGIWGVK